MISFLPARYVILGLMLEATRGLTPILGWGANNLATSDHVGALRHVRRTVVAKLVLIQVVASVLILLLKLVCALRSRQSSSALARQHIVLAGVALAALRILMCGVRGHSSHLVPVARWQWLFHAVGARNASLLLLGSGLLGELVLDLQLCLLLVHSLAYQCIKDH